MLKSVASGEFKQHCLALMKEVAATGEELLITTRGKPLCRMVPVASATCKPKKGWMKGTVRFQGNVTQPINEPWDAMQ